ncbi:uncharacterized protein LOC135351574 isoform X3 [Halichondria panicea]|uniref:uncharacterized protein LOC135351574 isoform X3 n=1 Tax=Halichondria panicea TaxID=6063 RepID=UPI00312B7689
MQLTHLPSSPLQVMSVEQLSVQRKSLQRSVSVGCLSSGELLLTLRKGRGSHGNTTLTLEEALFNMECGGLEPCCNQLPVTIQQVQRISGVPQSSGAGAVSGLCCSQEGWTQSATQYKHDWACCPKDPVSISSSTLPTN